MSGKNKLLLGTAAALAAALVLMTVGSPQAKKGADVVSGVWVYEERVDASTCEIEQVGTRRGLLLTIEQGPPAKNAKSKLAIHSEGPTQYSTYTGKYDLAHTRLKVTATAGKKNVSYTSVIDGKLSSENESRMQGTRDVKIVWSKKGKPVSTCKVLTSFTARRM